MLVNRLGRYRMIALIFSVVILIGTFLVPSSAQAGVQTAWGTTGGGDHLIVGPDNLPRVLNCSTGVVDTYEESGDVAWSATSSTAPTDVGCGNMRSWSPKKISDSISASGNMVVSTDTNSNDRSDTIELWDDSGNLLWQHPVINECNSLAEIGASPIISNGLVVFTYSSCFGWGDYNIIGLDEDDHSIVYDIALGYVDNTASLAWSPDGVLLYASGEWRHFSNSGIEDPSRSISTGNENKFAFHVDGSVVFVMHDENDYDTCYLIFRKSGEPDVQKGISCDTQFGDAKTMPNGDLVAITDYGSDTASGVVTIFHKLNVPNTVIEVGIPSSGDTYFMGLYNIYVDANGNILTGFAYVEDVPVDGYPFVYQYYRTAFDVYTEYGSRFYSWSSDVYGEVSVSSSPMISLANGSVYLNDAYNNRLIDVRIPSISISYYDSVRWGVSGNAHQGASYVALGDSFSAGSGSFNPDIDEHCKRSSNNYAYYIKNHSTTITETPDVVACHGAVTADIMPSLQDISQSEMVGLNTDHVTLTIGGNDVGFEEVLKKCVNPDGFIPLFGYGCSNESSVTDAVTQRMEALAGHSTVPRYEPKGKEIHSIKNVLTEITTAAPNAEVYIAGYPKLFADNPLNFESDPDAPSTFSCDVSSASGYDPITIDYADATWMNSKADELNTIINDAVEVLKLQGKKVHYVSPGNFDGHGLCDSATSWLNGVEIVNAALEISPHSMHPTVSGYSSGYGDAFIAEID
jgi:lysophospholipase L1-like esterase